MRTGVSFIVGSSDRLRLEGVVRDRSAAQKHVWRAAIILLSADGVGTHEIMRRTGKSKTCVWRWQERFMEEGVVIVHIGLLEAEGGLDVRKFTLQEITFIGTYTYTMADFRDTVAALDAGVLGELSWIEKRPLAEGASAFRDLLEGRAGAAKIVLMP